MNNCKPTFAPPYTFNWRLVESVDMKPTDWEDQLSCVCVCVCVYTHSQQLLNNGDTF